MNVDSMNVYEKLSHPAAMAVFLLTLLLPILVGVIASRKTKDQADFFIGGRAMGKIVVALSAVSSGRSSWLVLGVSGIAYKMGVGAIWAILGYVIVEAVQFVTVGRRLRKESKRMEAITILDYFESRFADTTQQIRWVGVFIIGIFITAYVSAQFNAGAKTISTALEFPFGISLVISAGLVMVYMVLGGYVAVAYNDVVRAIIMIVGLVVLPVVALVKMGGLGIFYQIILEIDRDLFNPIAVGTGTIIGFLGIGLGSPGQPHIVVRYMSIDDPKNLTGAALVGTFWNVVLGIGAVCIGLVARALFPDVTLLPQQDPETAYLVLSSAYLDPVFYGFLVGGIFAAILSTADSQLLVVASTGIRDFYEKIVKRNVSLSEDTKIKLSRWVVVITGGIAVVLAYMADEVVFWLVLFAWGGLGASLGPTLILSLYWNRTTKSGVVAGMVMGTSITILWKLFFKEPTGIYELIPAFLGSLFATVAVSLVSSRFRNSQS